MVLGAWIVLAGGALLVAGALDSPVGEGARDVAQPAAVGTVATPQTAPGADPDAPAEGALPPLALVLDRPLPEPVAGLAPGEQLEQLRQLGISTRDPDRFVELGSLLQLAGDGPSAQFSYESALRFDAGSIGARVGLALVDGATGEEGLVRASAELGRLAARYPQSQLVSFNRGWLEIYRGRAVPARTAWQRTVALDPDSRLGRTATALLTTLENTPGGRNP
jgi:hypothetical protein